MVRYQWLPKGEIWPSVNLSVQSLVIGRTSKSQEKQSKSQDFRMRTVKLPIDYQILLGRN